MRSVVNIFERDMLLMNTKEIFVNEFEIAKALIIGLVSSFLH